MAPQSINQTEETQTSVTSNQSDSLSKQFDAMIRSMQEELPDLINERYSGVYSDITVTGENNQTITYTYRYAASDDVDFASLSGYFEEAEATWKQGMRIEFIRIKKEVPEIEIKEVTIKAIYLDPDGNELARLSVKQDEPTIDDADGTSGTHEGD